MVAHTTPGEMHAIKETWALPTGTHQSTPIQSAPMPKQSTPKEVQSTPKEVQSMPKEVQSTPKDLAVLGEICGVFCE